MPVMYLCWDCGNVVSELNSRCECGCDKIRVVQAPKYAIYPAEEATFPKEFKFTFSDAFKNAGTTDEFTVRPLAADQTIETKYAPNGLLVVMKLKWRSGMYLKKTWVKSGFLTGFVVSVTFLCPADFPAIENYVSEI